MGGPSSAAPRAHARDSADLAPSWHTAALVVLYLAVAATGLLFAHDRSRSELPIGTSRIVRVYAPMVVVQLLLVAYVTRVARPRGTLRALIGASGYAPRRVAEDMALAFVGWIVITAVEIAWARFVPHAPTPAAVSMLLPNGGAERVAWIVVAASVALGEEVVFRGYLRTQFAARFRDVRLAIVLQAVLFGLAHAEQGLGAALRDGLYGLGLGIVAQWRRSLVPCIACHAWTDLASGLWHI
jgi:membrane protease YdiL (CAAX protease family)